MRGRLIYGWSLFIGMLVALFAGGLVWGLFFGVFSVLGGNEYIALMRAKGMKPSPRIIRSMIIGFFVIASLPNIMALFGRTLPADFALQHFPLVLTVGVCASFFRLLFRTEQPPATIADIATTILGFIYVGWLMSHLVLLRNLMPPGSVPITNPLHQPGLAYAWACLFAVVSTDVFAFYVGKKWGKHLLYPAVSPKKTVEGALGGLFASMFWVTVVVYLSDNFLFPGQPFRGNLWQAPLMGAVVSIAAQLGDLCESLLKRDAGVKDSGNLIPGHGGILDRGDGLMFGSAISFYWVSAVVLGIL